MNTYFLILPVSTILLLPGCYYLVSVCQALIAYHYHVQLGWNPKYALA